MKSHTGLHKPLTVGNDKIFNCPGAGLCVLCKLLLRLSSGLLTVCPSAMQLSKGLVCPSHPYPICKMYVCDVKNTFFYKNEILKKMCIRWPKIKKGIQNPWKF